MRQLLKEASNSLNMVFSIARYLLDKCWSTLNCSSKEQKDLSEIVMEN